jgi:HMG (high mobility group) box
MNGQFAGPMNIALERPMSNYSDAHEYAMDNGHPVNGSHLIDISTSGYAIPTTSYMGLPRSHPMQGRAYYDTPVFDDGDCDERSPSPSLHDQVKRPLNAFMLYRKDKQGEIPTSNHQSVSRIIGAMWKSESAETKARYNALAQKEREIHRLNYPGYKYSPKKRINKDKKVKRTMSQAAHAKRQEEEKNILRQINKRSKSETTLTKLLPEMLPLPKSKQLSLMEQRPKSKTPVPEHAPRILPQVRSQSAQPTFTPQDFSKFTSNPRCHDQPEDFVPQSYSVPSQFPDHFEYFSYPPGPYMTQSSGETSFDSETDSFTTEMPTGDMSLLDSPAPFTPLDESQIYGGTYLQRTDDVEVFRIHSPFAGEQKPDFNGLGNPRVQDVFEQWSRESTVNPQDLMAQPDNL